MAMVRARAGGTGRAFNLGEMTMTRCTLRTDDGPGRHVLCRRPLAAPRGAGGSDRRAAAGSRAPAAGDGAGHRSPGAGAGPAPQSPGRTLRPDARRFLHRRPRRGPHMNQQTKIALQNLAPGFHDPQLDAQRVFRQLLQAMARPGQIVPIDRLPEAPKPLSGGAAALALTLFDLDTPIWLDEALRDGGGRLSRLPHRRAGDGGYRRRRLSCWWRTAGICRTSARSRSAMRNIRSAPRPSSCRSSGCGSRPAIGCAGRASLVTSTSASTAWRRNSGARCRRTRSASRSASMRCWWRATWCWALPRTVVLDEAEA